MSAKSVSLREASAQLGLHYMTVYRHIRTGRLPAHRNGSTWEVDVADLARFTAGRRAPTGTRGRPVHARRVPDLAARLVEGDEAGAWTLVESVSGAGATPQAVYIDLFVPALRRIGELWERGEIGIAEEHRATVVMQRLVGRMGPRFRRPGRPRGTIVLGAPEGELHGLPTALVADLLRVQGFVVVDLGANVPTDSFVDCVLRLPALAVGVAVTMPGRLPAARRLVRALRRAGVRAPILVGGAGITEAEATRIGADLWARDGDVAARLLAG
ncbi:MAG TPA: cobalamin-dependent protein [Candidatus Dormibacteraeota bacterium]